MVNTPGSVQPGNGMTRSIAPVAQDDRLERNPLDPSGAERVGDARLDVPDQGVGAIVDAVLHGVESRVHGLRLARLEAVKRGGRPSESRGRPAIDLAAAARAFVDHNRRNAVADERLGRPRSRRAGADDQHRGFVAAHDTVPGVRDSSSGARTRMPAHTSVVHARVRIPSSSTTQQS